MAFALVAAAFLVDRLASAANEAPPQLKATDRDASPADLAVEREDRGRQATSPSDIPDRLEGYSAAHLF